MQKSTQWILTTLVGGALIWSCSPQQLVSDAVSKAKETAASAAPGTVASAAASAAPGVVASAAPGTVASSLPGTLPSGLPSGIPSGLLTGGLPGLVPTGTCAAVLQCAAAAQPALAEKYKPFIDKPNSFECQSSATGALVTFPQCKK